MDFNPAGEASTVALIYFKRKFPYNSVKHYDYKKDDKRRRRFSVISTFSIIAAILYLFGLPVFYTAVLSVFIPAIYEMLLPAGAMYYPPEWLMYLLICIPLTIGTLIWVHEWTFKLFLQNDYEEFEDFYNDRQGYNNKKAGVRLAKIGLVFTLLFLPFIVGSRVIVYNDSITLKQFYQIKARNYKFEDIAQINLYSQYQNRKGEITESNHYVLQFTDGFEFYVGYYLNDDSVIQSFTRDLSKRSGRPINEGGIDYYEE
ncbi:MAG: hypothetical protein H3C54_05355 [Taibaiella sp.]|nr:hypothetical protein [Taibaiella sp.]